MFGKFITQMRKKTGCSQAEVAGLLKISRQTYLLMEQDKREPSIAEVAQLAALFGLSTEQFLQQKASEISIEITVGKKPSLPTPAVRISVPQEKAEKFTQVLCYILRKVGGKPNIGMTALYKLLYFIDFDYYEKYEEQLMGLVYIKNHYGPTPPLFKKITEQMIAKGDLEIIKSKFYQRDQKKYLINPRLEPNLSILNGQEKEHIDKELERLSDMTATQLSDLSHRDVPWITAEQGQPLEYESVFYRTPETSVRTYREQT